MTLTNASAFTIHQLISIHIKIARSLLRNVHETFLVFIPEMITAQKPLSANRRDIIFIRRNGG